MGPKNRKEHEGPETLKKTVFGLSWVEHREGELTERRVRGEGDVRADARC